MDTKLTKTMVCAAALSAAAAWGAESATVEQKLAVAVEAKPAMAESATPAATAARPLVQLAILLDTSGSMDGMIKQAQTQLWAIVNEFATAKHDGKAPILQVALYRYGNDGLPAASGHIEQLLPLTDDLDKVSESLFRLTTNGGNEYCGWVIRDATRDLKWSDSAKDYRAIFIAGNEPFNQGKVDFRESCKAAITKGIIVNTIHCAGAEDTFWKDGAALADGQFLKIDGNRAVVDVTAPQDAEIAKLNGELNKTYIAYGRAGAEYAERQVAMDSASSRTGLGSFSGRAAAKASAQYRNSSWDVVDAMKEGKVKIEEIQDKDLPEEMRKMTPEERKAHVAAKEKARAEIQAKIKMLAKEREAFIAAETKKNINQDTLGEKVRETIRSQAMKSGFAF